MATQAGKLIVAAVDFSPGIDYAGNVAMFGNKMETSTRIRFTWPRFGWKTKYVVKTLVPEVPDIPFEAVVLGSQLKISQNPQNPDETQERQTVMSFEDFAKYPIIAIYEYVEPTPSPTPA